MAAYVINTHSKQIAVKQVGSQLMLCMTLPSLDITFAKFNSSTDFIYSTAERKIERYGKNGGKEGKERLTKAKKTKRKEK